MANLNKALALSAANQIFVLTVVQINGSRFHFRDQATLRFAASFAIGYNKEHTLALLRLARILASKRHAPINIDDLIQAETELLNAHMIEKLPLNQAWQRWYAFHHLYEKDWTLAHATLLTSLYSLSPHNARS